MSGGHDHPRDMRLRRPHDRHGIAGRLDDDFVLLVQRAPKPLEACSRHIHPPGGAELARSQGPPATGTSSRLIL